jgi:YD repeat-containing protein
LFEHEWTGNISYWIPNENGFAYIYLGRGFISIKSKKTGNITKETRPLGGAIQYSYDQAGQLVKRTDAAGNTKTYAYDATQHLITEEHYLGGAALDERISYNRTSSLHQDGFWTYNADNELLREQYAKVSSKKMNQRRTIKSMSTQLARSDQLVAVLVSILLFWGLGKNSQPRERYIARNLRP